MPDFRQATAGEPLVIPAADYNAMLAAARDYYASRGPGVQSGPLTELLTAANLVLVRNDTGSSLDALSVVKPGAPVISPAAFPQEVRRRPCLAGLTPTATSDQPLITIDRLAPNQIGRAAVAGVCVVEVDVTSTSHHFANCTPSSTFRLTSATSGLVRILNPLSATGHQLCVVLLGLPPFSLFSGARVTRATDVSVSNNTDTTITFAGEDFDTDNYHSTVSNTGRLTVPADGYYAVGGQLSYLNSAHLGNFELFILNDLTGKTVAHLTLYSAAVIRPTLNCSGLSQASAGDYFTMHTIHNTGSTETVDSSLPLSFWIQKVG